MVEKDAAILRKKGLLEAYFPSTHNNLFTVTLLLLLLQHHTLVHQHAYVKEVHFEIIVIQIPVKRCKLHTEYCTNTVYNFLTIKSINYA